MLDGLFPYGYSVPVSLLSPPSILRHRTINLISPGQDAALQVFDLCEPGLLHHVVSLCAAAAHLAMHDDLFFGVEFVDASGELAERDQARAIVFQIRDLPLMRFAHVD